YLFDIGEDERGKTGGDMVQCTLTHYHIRSNGQTHISMRRSGKEGEAMHRRAPSFHPGLMTDMYHPDSAYVSWRSGHNGLTTFDLYTRTAPFGGAYLLVAGLEAALEFVQSFLYTPEEVKFLAHIRDYDSAFLDELAELRFTGEILAPPEGSIAFPNEPLMRVTAPFREAILLEAGLLQAIGLSTLI